MDSTEQKYQQCIDWLFSQLPMFSRIGAPAYKAGLETTLTLDSLYGHPHKKFRSIHIGGTNGKGSTSHMLASILQAEGYKTGLYTSPHLTDFRERMRVNGNKIPRNEVIEFVENWKTARNNDQIKDTLKPSFFELTMMMAFDWFAKENVDFAVIEVGMGGRLDSTNIIIPLLSIITNISFDHTQFLGTSLESIAREKAGIIKAGVPVVIGEGEGKVKEVFLSKANEVKAPIFFADNLSLQHIPDKGWSLPINSGRNAIVPLGGEYQKQNINTVAKAVSVIREGGIKISDKAVILGLENVGMMTGLRGRWQKIQNSPVVICDTGHNVSGLTQNLETLKRDYPEKQLNFILGFVNDKDVNQIVSMFPKTANFYFTRANIPRAMKAEEVALKFASVGITGEIIPDVGEAYKTVLGKASENEVIFIGGSTFVVADLLSSLEKI